MSHRPNQYQRRQAKRFANRMYVFSFFLTILVFAIGYLLVRNSLFDSMYQEIFASNNGRTLEEVQAARFDAYILPAITVFIVVWLTLAVILVFVFRRKPTTFSFLDSAVPIVDIQTGHDPDLYMTTPSGFEEQVAWLITQQTGLDTKVIGGSGDKGADVKVFDSNRKLVGVVQCKRYNPRRAVDPKYVQQMVGVKQTYKVNIVYLATTAYFTEETRKLAKQLDVRLIDGRDLRNIRRKTAI